VGAAGEPPFVSTASHLNIGYGWKGYGAGFAPVGFSKDQLGVVHLSGLMCTAYLGTCTSTGTSGPGITFMTLFTLPVGYRPAARLVFQIHESDRSGRVDVAPTGEVIFAWTDGPTHAFVSVDGVSFPAAA
jgi:hypothetical protein